MKSCQNVTEGISERDIFVDILKGLLVIQMILAHCLQINGTGDYYRISPIANTVCFTGFTFCFGFATWRAYFSEQKIKRTKALTTSLKCLIAYFISALFHEIVRKGNGLSSMVDILTFKILAGYSEFLLSFCLMILVPVILRRVIDIATNNEWSLMLASAVCSITTFYHPESPNPLLGSLIGGNNFSYFPVVSYFPVFMAGVYASKKRKLPLTLCAIGIISLLVKLSFHEVQMPRFPPSILWVASSFGALIVYRLLASALINARISILITSLKKIGENVLSYLLLSNMLIFTFSRIGYVGRDINTVVALFLIIISTATFVIFLNNRQVRK